MSQRNLFGKVALPACMAFFSLHLTSLIFNEHRILNRPDLKTFYSICFLKWWAYLDLNQGPRPYQGRALTN